MEHNRARSVDLSIPEENATPDMSWHLLVDRLLHKDAIPPPKVFHKNQSIASHLKAVERYMSALHIVNTQSKVATLLNTLDEDVHTELYAQSDFEIHEADYPWIAETLTTMYKKKSTLMSPLIHLLNIKQKSGQTLEKYATELRVEAYRHWENESSAKKEEILVKAFMKGIFNRHLAVAIQAAQPTTLEAALQLGRKCSKAHDISESNEMTGVTGHVRAINQNAAGNVTLQLLHDQILSLQEQIRRLESLFRYADNRTFAEVAKINNRAINSFGQRPYFNMKPNFPVRNSPILSSQQQPKDKVNGGNVICYNCNETGHISRNCPVRGTCYRCNGRNHIATNYPQGQTSAPRRQQYVRRMDP